MLIKREPEDAISTRPTCSDAARRIAPRGLVCEAQLAQHTGILRPIGQESMAARRPSFGLLFERVIDASGWFNLL